MSFSAKVKGEICRYTDISKEEALAELSAIMKGSGTIGFSGKVLALELQQKIQLQQDIYSLY